MLVVLDSEESITDMPIIAMTMPIDSQRCFSPVHAAIISSSEAFTSSLSACTVFSVILAISEETV